MSEDELVRWLREQPQTAGLLGDDAAMLPRAGPWAVTVDTQLAGVHFPADLDLGVLARRLLAVNLSDLAAMGAVPRYGFLTLSAPPGFDHRRFFRALLDAFDRHSLILAGGDLERHSVLGATLTLLGERCSGGRWLRRGCARPGDRLWVGGSLGESSAGCKLVARGARIEGKRVLLPPPFDRPPLERKARRAVRRHLLPEAQLVLGQWLARRRRCAAIDISDGLAKDLRRLCDASDAGGEIEQSELPLAPGLEALAEELGCRATELALGGGEDYVLLFALPPRVSPPDRLGCTAIGRVVEQGVWIVESGERRVLPPMGWDHLADTGD